jgi:tRNA (cmo5U34)-methyltransferase
VSHSVQSHLKVSTYEYDTQIRRFIPGYNDMLEMVCNCQTFFETRIDHPLRIVELGSGTGALTERPALRSPDAAITAVDCDSEMLQRAKERLSRFGIRYLVGTFEEGLDPGYDIVTASLALHHLLEKSAKISIYRRIFAALDPGGAFINADAMIDSHGPLRERAFQIWTSHMIANGISHEAAINHLHEWQNEDRYFSLVEEFGMLKEAGFSNIDVLWRNGPVSVIAATK